MVIISSGCRVISNLRIVICVIVDRAFFSSLNLNVFNLACLRDEV